METMNLRSNQETERAPVHALADACQLLVAAIEQINLHLATITTHFGRKEWQKYQCQPMFALNQHFPVATSYYFLLL